MYLSVLKHNLLIISKSEKQDCARQKIEIEKKEGPLLERRIKDVEAELKNLGASQKEVHKTHSKDVQAFFRKARWWRAKKIENNLFQQIKEEDIEVKTKGYMPNRCQGQTGWIKSENIMTRDFLPSREIGFIALTRLNSKNGLKKQDTHILQYEFYSVNLSLTTSIRKEEQ